MAVRVFRKPYTRLYKKDLIPSERVSQKKRSSQDLSLSHMETRRYWSDGQYESNVTDPEKKEIETVFRGKEAVPNEFTLSFFDWAEMKKYAESARKKEIVILGEISALNTLRIRLPHGMSLSDALALEPRPVESSSNFFVFIPEKSPSAPVPDGRVYKSFGDTAMRWVGADMLHEGAGKGVVIAILDDGVGYHPALDGATVLRMHNAVSAEESPHGTMVASLIAGQEKAFTGTAPGATLISYKVMGISGEGDTFTLASAIVDAVNAGATVINISLSAYGNNKALESAVEYASERGVVIVAAGGNDGVNMPVYPAAYSNVNVLGVAAVDATGQRVYFSNIGSHIDIAAPGVGINAAAGDGDYELFSGTSLAAPIVAGSIAGILSMNQGMSSDDAIKLLGEFASDAGDVGSDEEYGAGIINLQRVLEKDEVGIYDIAMGDITLLHQETGLARLGFLIQNRGTERLRNVWLEFWDDIQQGGDTIKAGDFGVGESKLIQREFKWMPNVGLSVFAVVGIDGIVDVRSFNNTRRLTIIPRSGDAE